MALISKLENIADAIREKTGKEDKLTLDEMAVEIAAIETGGGSAELPEEAFLISGNCNYRLSFNGWNWYLKEYGKKITTKNINSASQMFAQSNTLEEIPFDINITNNCKNISSIFYYCQELKEVPLIKGELTAPTGDYSGTLDMGSMFTYCNNLRNIPYDYFHNFGGDAFWEASKNYKGNRGYMFQNCYSLRQLPDISMMKIKDTSAYSGIYYCTFTNCYALDEITNLPVLNACAFTSNAFYSTFEKCSRVKDITFETNEDGTPIAVSWKNQMIDLTKYVGIVYSGSNITGYNSGITGDKWVANSTKYEELKNDPDWYTTSVPYSRYNHDSAVNTINSLPDASSGSGNTIKFAGAAGANTDGGAINTLTEEEIAVAAAKGWTVTIA